MLVNLNLVQSSNQRNIAKSNVNFGQKGLSKQELSNLAEEAAKISSLKELSLDLAAAKELKMHRLVEVIENAVKIQLAK